MTDAEIDVIYWGVEALICKDEMEFLNKHLELILPSIWRRDIDELLSYLTATYPCKSKLPARQKFLDTCKKLFPDEKMWNDL